MAPAAGNSKTRGTANATASTEKQRIRVLKSTKRAFKIQIDALRTHLANYQDSSIERIKLEERVERIREAFKGFNKIQDELGSVEDFDDVERERQTTTDAYDDVIANARLILKQIEQSAIFPSASSSSGLPTPSPTPSNSLNALTIRLPKIDLPKFDGHLEKWVSFKDTFETMIHSHPGLNDIQRLQYLRLSLIDGAESTIEAFPITENNYKAAWNQLLETFDNTRALVLRHATLLRETPAMQDDSAESIRDLLNHVQSHMRSLHALGRSDTDIANDLVTSIVLSKMGPETLKAWENTLTGTRMPRLEDLYKYLRNASHQSKSSISVANVVNVATAHSSRRLDQVATASTTRRSTRAQTFSRHEGRGSPTNKRRSTSWSASSPPPNRRFKGQTFAITTRNCKVCDGTDHATFQCAKFMEMKIDERIQAAQNANLCLNCLQSDHTTKACRAGRCRVCNGHHNTRLHRETTDATPGPST